MMMYFSILKPDDDKINSLAADDVYELVDDSIEKYFIRCQKDYKPLIQIVEIGI